MKVAMGMDCGKGRSAANELQNERQNGTIPVPVKNYWRRWKIAGGPNKGPESELVSEKVRAEEGTVVEWLLRKIFGGPHSRMYAATISAATKLDVHCSPVIRHQMREKSIRGRGQRVSEGYGYSLGVHFGAGVLLSE
jgi:hypothetical protein